MALTLLSGCGDVPVRRPVLTPETVAPYQIDTGFTDLNVAPSMGHTVPVEGEVISIPSCVAEARGGQECR